jgi:hypothetical protein
MSFSAFATRSSRSRLLFSSRLAISSCWRARHDVMASDSGDAGRAAADWPKAAEDDACG